MDVKLRTYIKNRRAEIEERRRAAALPCSEWAADCAIHELDRLVGWLNLSRQWAVAEDRARDAAEQTSAGVALELER